MYRNGPHDRSGPSQPSTRVQSHPHKPCSAVNRRHEETIVFLFCTGWAASSEQSSCAQEVRTHVTNKHWL